MQVRISVCESYLRSQPLEIARKLEARLNPEGDLDAVLDRLRRLDVQAVGLPRFDQAIVEDTIAAL